MSGNWFGRNEYAFIENQYHETIEVKFDVQRSFTKRKSTGGKGGVGGFGVTIGGGGFTEEKIDWNIVKPGFTSLQPGHAIDRDTNLKGDVYLTVETNDKKVNICRWPVKSDTSWVITTRGELQQTKTKYKQPPPTETDSKNRESKRTTDEPNKFDDNTNEQKAESKGQKQNMKQSLGQNDYSELENQGKTYDEYGNEDDECKKANIKGKTIMWKPPKPKQKMYGYSFKVEDTAQESADTGSFSDRIYECSESEIQEYKEHLRLIRKDDCAEVTIEVLGKMLRYSGYNPTSSELQDLMQAVDFDERNKTKPLDGCLISKEELAKNVMQLFGRNPTKRELQDIVHEVDGGGDGSIDFPEYQIAKKMVQDVDRDEEMRDAFKKFDLNNDGFISADELSKVMKIFEGEMTQKEISDMIKEMDTDGDGKINYNEFVSIMNE